MALGRPKGFLNRAVCIAGHKICTKCKLELPVTAFHKDKRAKDGLSFWCKECTKKYMKEHYKNNSEKILASCAKWRENNPEKLAEYYKKNSKRMYAVQVEYRKNNPEKTRAKGVNYRKNNLEKVRATEARNRKKNIEKNRARSTASIKDLSNAYVAKKLGFKVSEIPPELIEAKRLNLKIKRKLKEIQNENA